MVISRIFKRLLKSEKWLRMMVKLTVIKLKWKANRCTSVEDCVNLVFNTSNVFPFIHTSMEPTQVREEILQLLKILAKRKPKFVLEIGTAKGGTLFLFTRVSSSDAVTISIDLPHGRFGGGYPDWRVPLYKSFAILKQKIYLIRKDSHALSTLNIVEQMLGENNLGFLFIDGDHTYDGVKKDFEMYSKLVRKGGIIALHDIVPGPPEKVGGVPRFWDEIKHCFKHVELVGNWKLGGYGIGIIYV
jgi:predicted O-methyltransferase YrrM